MSMHADGLVLWYRSRSVGGPEGHVGPASHGSSEHMTFPPTSVGPVQIGIIGAGSVVAARHLPNLRKHPAARVVAICRRNPEWLAHIAREFEISGRYRDYRA